MDEFREQPVGVNRACLSLDGTRIAEIFADNTICIYDTTTGESGRMLLGWIDFNGS